MDGRRSPLYLYRYRYTEARSKIPRASEGCETDRHTTEDEQAALPSWRRPRPPSARHPSTARPSSQCARPAVIGYTSSSLGFKLSAADCAKPGTHGQSSSYRHHHHYHGLLHHHNHRHTWGAAWPPPPPPPLPPPPPILTPSGVVPNCPCPVERNCALFLGLYSTATGGRVPGASNLPWAWESQLGGISHHH